MVALEPIDTRLPITVVRATIPRRRRCRPAGGEGIIDEHHAVTDKAILADRHQLADEGVRLHPASGAPMAPPGLDLGERPDKTIVPDLAAIDIAGFDRSLPALTELDVAHADLMRLADCRSRRAHRGCSAGA